jgi:hypothetical protein
MRKLACEHLKLITKFFMAKIHVLLRDQQCDLNINLQHSVIESTALHTVTVIN